MKADGVYAKQKRTPQIVDLGLENYSFESI